MHLNWKGMFHDSSLLAVPNNEAEAVDGVRDNLDAEHTTTHVIRDNLDAEHTTHM